MSKIITFIIDEELVHDRIVNDINSGKSTTIIVDCLATVNAITSRLTKDHFEIKVKKAEAVNFY